MRLHNRLLACFVLLTVGLSAACVDVVVSLKPWFEIEDAGSARFDTRFLGVWCSDDEDCDKDEALYWKAGPANSFNVFEGERLRYRVWLGEIDGTRYLDWWFLCEPSAGVETDDCMELDFPLGTHVAARIERMEDDEFEFRILESEQVELLLASDRDPVRHGKVSDITVILEDTERLQEFLVRAGADATLWSEETIRMTRPNGD